MKVLVPHGNMNMLTYEGLISTYTRDFQEQNRKYTNKGPGLTDVNYHMLRSLVGGCDSCDWVG